MRDLLRDAGNTTRGWTNNSDIMSACCVKFSSVPMQRVHVYVATVRDARSEKQQLQHVLQDSHIGNIPTYVQVHSALCRHLQAHSGG